MSDPTDYSSLAPCDALSLLDRINSAIVESPDLDTMLPRVLDEVLDGFQADRAWFMYPCDAETDEIVIRCERFRPEWPGLSTVGGVLPTSDSTRRFLTLCQNSVSPIRFDPELDPIDALKHEAYIRFDVKSQLVLPLSPSQGPNWVLAIQHCAQPVVYDRVVPLFHAVGKRIANGLTTAMTLEDLRVSEGRYRALVDNATEAILVSDFETGKYVEANPAAEKLLDIPLEDLCCKLGPVDFSPEFQPDGSRSADKAKRYIQDALDGEFPKFEWTHQTKDGVVIPCEISLGRFPHPTRQLVRGTIVDISERKAAEAQRAKFEKRLAQSQKLETVGHLTGGVAHDFNNLLSVVLGNLELLLLETDQSDGAKKLIQNCIGATYKGADLTKSMLSYARKAQLTPQQLQLNTVIEQINDWSGRTIPATIDLKVSLADDLWPVMADIASTESAILNLVINARDAMKDFGTLTIETCNVTVSEEDSLERTKELEPGNYVMLAISDTGEGIAPDQLGRIFEPFFTTKATGKGSGLGLSMVHGFMKQSLGNVRVYSEIGVGTTVKLFFPSTVPADTTDPSPKDNVPEAALSRVRILVAEDQPEVLEIVVRILKTAGHDVVGARSGDLAFEAFKDSGPFDLLMTDIVMPGTLQGPTLARDIRAIEPTLPIVFMTGYAREAAMHGNGLRDEDIRLMKPVSRTDLLGAVDTAMRRDTERN